MTVDLALLRPLVRNKAPGSAGLSAPERVYLDTLQALADSLRSPEEMAEAASVLNPLLTAHLATRNPAPLDEVAARILKAAQGARDARSGMGVDLCLDYLHLAFDDARKLLET